MIVALFAGCAATLWLRAERGALVRGSTWRMVRLNGWRRLLSLSTLHGYVYGRWTQLYLRVGRAVAERMGPRGKRWLAEHYHSKVLTTDLATALVTVEEDIPLRDLEQVMPYSRAREFVLSGPPDIAALECPCRLQSTRPCQPTQVCLVVGQPYVDSMLEHHPETCRRLSPAEAAELLEQEHLRGHVHTAWFKESTGGRFYAICNCCPCCCGGIEAMNRLGIPMVRSSGYVAHVAAERCTGCGRCVAACPFGALHQEAPGTPARRDWERCLGCGVCVSQCAREAIALCLEPRKGPPLDVRAMVGAGRSNAMRANTIASEK